MFEKKKEDPGTPNKVRHTKSAAGISSLMGKFAGQQNNAVIGWFLMEILKKYFEKFWPFIGQFFSSSMIHHTPLSHPTNFQHRHHHKIFKNHPKNYSSNSKRRPNQHFQQHDHPRKTPDPIPKPRHRNYQNYRRRKRTSQIHPFSLTQSR